MRKGQYSLIVFVIATYVLLSLTGIVSNIISEQGTQIQKSQELTTFSDYINGITTIIYQERQLGIDTAGYYLGSLGIWPHGTSKCGSARNLSSYWIMKDIPYWKSSNTTGEFYRYEGEKYSETNEFRVFRFRDVRAGLYKIEPSGIGGFLLDDSFENRDELFLSSGDHLILVTNNKPLKDYSIGCTNASPSTIFPDEIRLIRSIPEGSEYELCVPPDDIISSYFEKILNTYFNTLNYLAVNLITNDYIASAGFKMNLQFPGLITYTADVEVVGDNALYITFYPIIGQSFRITHYGLINSSFTGSTIVHNAFDSDLARFRNAGVDVVTNSVIGDVVSKILDDHSYFELLVQYKVNGSSNRYFEIFINDTYGEKLNFNVFDNEKINFNDFFGTELKPYCLYYLKEVCQFMSNEISNHTIGNYELYDAFTSKKYVSLFGQSDVSVLAPSCQSCFDLSSEQNPCINITDIDCQTCFALTVGETYDDADNELDCRVKVNDDIVPLLTDYIYFKLRSIEQALEERYGFDWRLDPSRLNITDIRFDRVEDAGSLFNSSCTHCSPVTYGSAVCKEFKPDIKMEFLSLSVNDPANDGSQVVAFTDSLITPSVTVKNNGLTTENSITVSAYFDAYSTMMSGNAGEKCTDPLSANSYPPVPVNILYPQVPSALAADRAAYDRLPVSGPDPDCKYDGYVNRTDKTFVRNIVVSVPNLRPGETRVVSLPQAAFVANSSGIKVATQGVLYCIESSFNDDYNLSNSCAYATFRFCENPDVDIICCRGAYKLFYGNLASVPLSFSSSTQGHLPSGGSSSATAGTGPSSVALGDIDNDGDLDMAVSNMVANTLSVLFNNGLGTYFGKTDYSIGGSPRGVKFGDIDNDGDLDLFATSLATGSFNVYFNDGSGVFSGTNTYTGVNNPWNIALGDLNVDGYLDLVVNSGSSFSAYFNDGYGFLIGRTDYATGASTTDIALSDLNGDNKLDVVTTNFGSGTITVYFNNGYGVFGGRTDYSTGVYPRGIALGDLDNDDDIDMVNTNYASNNFSVFFNRGTGSFGARTNYPINFPWSVALSDLNKDGYLDLIASNYQSNTLQSYINDGFGRFSGIISTFTVGNYPVGITTGDIDGDGYPEVLNANSDNSATTVSIEHPIYTFIKYGPCCGDDARKEETFFNDTSKKLACVNSQVIRIN